MIRSKLNYGFVLFISAIILYSVLWFVFFGQNVISSDGAVYYEYFVRTFITHDLSGAWIKYPAGTTLLQLPFLLIGYALSTAMKLELENGYNICFQVMVVFSGVFYGVWSFALIYKMLKRNHNERSCLFTCIALMCGTMIPVYMMEHASFSHIYGFFVCTGIMYYIIYYEERRESEKGRFLRDIVLGLMFGLAAIIRNTNVVMCFAYLFYRVTSMKSFRHRLGQVLSARLIPQAVGFATIYFFQMILWRIMAGKWVIYSYSGESFSYLQNPKIMEVLFSDAKGLFIFSPILLVGLISMVFFRWENEEFRIAQWLIFCTETYFIAAWWCWWLGGAYGERMFCDLLCIFAIPLASFFDNLEAWRLRVRNQSRSIKQIIPILCYIVIVSLILVNMIWIKGVRDNRISDNLASWFQLRTYLIYFLFK